MRFIDSSKTLTIMIKKNHLTKSIYSKIFKATKIFLLRQQQWAVIGQLGTLSISDKMSYHKISQPQDMYLTLSNRSEIWQAPRQLCCWGTCKISQWCDCLNYQSHGMRSSDKTSYRTLKRVLEAVITTPDSNINVCIYIQYTVIRTWFLPYWGLILVIFYPYIAGFQNRHWSNHIIITRMISLTQQNTTVCIFHGI